MARKDRNSTFVLKQAEGTNNGSARPWQIWLTSYIINNNLMSSYNNSLFKHTSGLA